jgi:glycosyltransferase involved in cell wall biosynthesis
MNSISVVIATYKPGLLLNEIVKNIQNQDFNNTKKDIEIIIVDGELSEETRSFAAREGLEYIENPNQDPLSAKYLGFVESKNDLICFIDQDEKFIDQRSLYNRLKSFTDNPDLCLYFPAGYLVSSELEPSNIYTTIFGDPINLFVYRMPNSPSRVRQIVKRLTLKESGDVYLNCSEYLYRGRILLEFGCMGTTVHRSRINANMGRTLQKADFAHFFYLLLAQNKPSLIAISKHELIEHDSSSTWRVTREKIKWRILNNYKGDTDLRLAGIRERIRIENIAAKKVGVFRNDFRAYQLAFIFQLLFPISTLLALFKESRKLRSPKLMLGIFLTYFLAFQSLRVAFPKFRKPEYS